MSLFDSRYYKVNTFLLRITGQWPYQENAKKRLIRFVALASLTFTLIPLGIRVYIVWGNLDETLECLPALCILLTSICKAVVYICKEQELTEILNYMQDDWNLWSSGKECEILRDYAESGRAFSILFTGNSYVTLTVFLTMSMSPIILNIVAPLSEPRPKQFVYPVEFFVDEEKYFNWIYMYGIWTATCTVTIVLACESMYAVCIQHACGLFAIVGYRLKNAIEEVDFMRTGRKEQMEDVLYKYISFSIERHNHAIKFADILETCYSPFLFFGMAFNMLEISVAGVQALLALGNLAVTVQYGGFAFGVIVHIFLISLPAQRLYDHSTAIAEDVYNGSWYLMPRKVKTLIRMIMLQGRIPCTLTALKFYTVNLITFSTVLKTSFSYFTVLSSTQT